MRHRLGEEMINFIVIEYKSCVVVQPEYGDEQGDAGRDCRTRLAMPNSQARTGTGKYSFSCLADHEQDWQPYPVDPSLAICDDDT